MIRAFTRACRHTNVYLKYITTLELQLSNRDEVINCLIIKNKKLIEDNKKYRKELNKKVF